MCLSGTIDATEFTPILFDGEVLLSVFRIFRESTQPNLRENLRNRFSDMPIPENPAHRLLSKGCLPCYEEVSNSQMTLQ